MQVSRILQLVLVPINRSRPPGFVVLITQHRLNLFERQTLRLRYQEEDEDESDDRIAAEQHECVRRSDGLRQAQECLRDDQVRDPIGNGGHSPADSSEPQGIDLGVDDPGGGSHAGRVRDDVSAETDERDPAEVARATLGVPMSALALAGVFHGFVGFRVGQASAGSKLHFIFKSVRDSSLNPKWNHCEFFELSSNAELQPWNGSLEAALSLYLRMSIEPSSSPHISIDYLKLDHKQGNSNC